MDLSLEKPRQVCLDVANGKKVSRRQGKAAVVAIHLVMQNDGYPSEAQLPVLRAVTELFDENGGKPSTLHQITKRSGLAYGTVHDHIKRLIVKKLVNKISVGARWRNLEPTERGRMFL